jgi:hypothetical protein
MHWGPRTGTYCKLLATLVLENRVLSAAFKDATVEPPPVGHLGCNFFQRQQALCTQSFLPIVTLSGHLYGTRQALNCNALKIVRLEIRLHVI